MIEISYITKTAIKIKIHRIYDNQNQKSEKQEKIINNLLIIAISKIENIVKKFHVLLQFSFIIQLMFIRTLKHLNYNFHINTPMQKYYQTGLKIKNSLTNQLEQFIPINGNNIYWYTCGPTVYSSSHMGHARNYICNDIIRNILTNHFGYNVKFGMNITDVDDKIIKGSKQQSIEYFEFAKKWEIDFFEDMKALGVEPPHYLSRVTQYIPEIVQFIDKIIQNGYAYPSKGSVYFNIEQYKKKYTYGKLQRVKTAQTQPQQPDQNSQKLNKEDFALWKAAKPGQPKWPSKWGDGRPGWHIECSAMASSILSKKLDIHSGGIDLIFPHHENQIAQSQAYFEEPNWVKYFIHVGHLHIKGCKMSKSLKNFITIKTLIKMISPRIIRLFFVMHKYDVVLDYDPQTSFQQAQSKDKRYKNFIGTLQTHIRTQPISKSQKIQSFDHQFDTLLQTSKSKIHDEFCNNFHTPGVIDIFDQLIKKTNTYLSTPNPKLTLIIKTYDLFRKNLGSLGLNYHAEQTHNQQNKQIINSIIKFRSSIRQNAKSDFKKILELCDRYRDEDLFEFSIKVQDKQLHQPSSWRYESKDIMMKEKQKKMEEQLKNQEKKKKNQEQLKNKMKINPKEMFLNLKKFTKFDQNGIPTHQQSNAGERPIKQSYKKSLIKQWNQQKLLYEKYQTQCENQQKPTENEITKQKQN